MVNITKLIASVTALIMLPLSLQAVEIDNDSDIFNLSLQELADINVTSVSKRTEKASQTAAALYVITQEDIRRSGLQSVPELLRLVPGLQVAQSGSQNWAISSRGFNSQFANKMLVLIDGRTLYTPVFSGVTWDVQNMILEDIDRIEVIRGPGATLWGANAVNGVINIITKSAKDTQGKLVTAATGNHERISGAARYGGMQEDFYYRAYGQYFDNNQDHLLDGNDAKDQWHNAQAGFRFDWDGAGANTGTLQGDVYKGSEGAKRYLPVTSTVSSSLENVVDDNDQVSGGNILGRWKHTFSKDSDITIQTYYDDVIRHFDNVAAGWHTQTLDFDLQHNILVNKYNNITWGLGYRRINSGAENSFYLSFTPQNFYENLYSGFLQDKIWVVQDKLALTLGTKIEHNDFTGFEYEPSVRLAYTPDKKQTFWTSVSRAVHTQSQADQNLNLVLAALPGTPTTILSELGQKNTISEELLAYELGYRFLPRSDLSLDITGFYNRYKHLASLSNGTPSSENDPVMGNYTYFPLLSQNDNHGETHGVEIASTWEVSKKIKLNGSYSLYYSHFDITGSSLVTKQGTSPTQQFSLRAYMDITDKWQLDTMLYRVDRLPAIDVPAYTRLDIRLGFAPVQGIDLSLIGQNLLQSQHQEYSGFLYQNPEEIGRSVVAKATFRF